MVQLSDRQRREIVHQELTKLRDGNYLEETTFKQVMHAYKRLDEEIHLKQQEPVIQKPKQGKVLDEKIITTNKKVEKVKKVKSPDQVRERNITWSLILGVVFVLVAGLVVATSNWAQMGPVLKVFSLSFVSIFFLMLSGVCKKFLQIHKTAFAFLTLGSMLIPIAIIAIGYFNLFGMYLSLTGEGRYLLGLMGSLLPLPLYLYNAYKLQSRLFVWVAYLFLTFTVGFMIASTKVSVDLFYFSIMVFNALLLYGYHRYRSKRFLAIFIKELPSYAQLNLVVSTLLLLFIYKQELFYSFNLLLTASLYMVMVYLYNTKEYQFVFSALFAYGVFQLTEHSFLESIDLVIFASIGLAYIIFALLSKSQALMASIFRYTSGVISALAFLYVSYEGLVIRAGEDSVILLFAYLIIACNYGYLAYLTNRKVFKYLSPFFLSVTGLQLWNTLQGLLIWESPALFIFILSTIQFMGIGLWNKNKYLVPLQTSTYYVSVSFMTFCILYGFVMEEFITVSIMLIVLGVVCILVANRNRLIEKDIAVWVNAGSWFLSMLVLFPKLVDWIPNYELQFNLPFHLGFSSIVILVLSLLWSRLNKSGLEISSFYVGQGMYLFALIILINTFTINEIIVRPLLLLVGTVIFTWLVLRSKAHGLWILVAITGFSFYTALLSIFSFQSFTATMTYLLVGPVLLLVVERLAGKKISQLRAYFFWFAQGVLLLLLFIVLLDQVMGQSTTPIILFIPFAIYVYCALCDGKEWRIKVQLYAAMTMVPLLLTTIIPYYGVLKDLPMIYGWFGASAIFAIGWCCVNWEWRSRLEWYIIPYSNYGLLTILLERGDFTIVEVIPLTGYIVLNLWFLHRRKWSIGTIFPLLLTIVMWEQYRYVIGSDYLFIISAGMYGILTLVGFLLYKNFYMWKQSNPAIDWYAITAVFYLVYSSTFIQEQDPLLVKILPILLLTVWLFIQANRFKKEPVKKVIKTVGATSVLPSYYLTIYEYSYLVPDLIYGELIAFPWLALAILLSLTTWTSHKKQMKPIQFSILVLITTYLVLDAIRSNTVWDAVIIGSLSLLSMVIGMQLRIRSYFFVGVATLMFNLIYQTKPYWGNMPWWGYLLVAGFSLIGVASYNEWKKQRGQEGNIEKKIKGYITKFKHWN